MDKIYATRYIPRYQKNYFEQECFERNLMSYIDHLKIHECTKDPNDYFNRVKVVNFDIIYNSCRGYLLMKSVKDQKTVYKNDFVAYLPEVKDKVVSAALRNKRNDLWIQRDLMI